MTVPRIMLAVAAAVLSLCRDLYVRRKTSWFALSVARQADIAATCSFHTQTL